MIQLLLYFVSLFFLSQFNGPEISMVGSITADSTMQAAGVMYVEENITNSFSPRKLNEEQFIQQLNRFRAAKTRLAAANVFLPGDLKLVGPVVNEAAILGYVDTVMRRCREAGVPIIVLGSGQARKLPQGFDSLHAAKQFISVVRKMAMIAEKYGRVIAIENLNSTETNFVLSLEQALAYVKAVDHPNFRLTADIYHMLMENEGPASIEKARGLLVHVHIAEKEERAFPGKRGTDFRPYFRALKSIGYQGKISLECRWKDLPTELPLSANYLKGQIREVW